MRFLLALTLLSFPYIALGVELPIAGFTFNAPFADLFALALVAFYGLDVLRARPVLPGPVGYAILLVAGALGALHAPSTGGSLYTLLRKPIFLYLAYGVTLATVVRDLGPARLRAPLLATATLLAALSIYASADRILAGSALWPDAPLGLTNNHKTLAVAAAPLVPLLLGLDRSRLGRLVAGALAVAIFLSWSRTAWITLGAGLSYFVVVGGRPLADRRGLVLGVVVVGFLAALYGPVLMGSAVQIDALRSRHSLDKRSWIMFRDHPLTGMGPGSSTKIELVTFPDYRVNGVDAHGVVQKVGSEHGLLGLFGYAAFVLSMAWRVRARHTLGEGLWPAFVALHTNLLLSTETFTQTHWAPLAVIWGLSLARR